MSLSCKSSGIYLLIVIAKGISQSTVVYWFILSESYRRRPKATWYTFGPGTWVEGQAATPGGGGMQMSRSSTLCGRFAFQTTSEIDNGYVVHLIIINSKDLIISEL